MGVHVHVDAELPSMLAFVKGLGRPVGKDIGPQQRVQRQRKKGIQNELLTLLSNRLT
jgi:hypothetical protein